MRIPKSSQIFYSDNLSFFQGLTERENQTKDNIHGNFLITKTANGLSAYDRAVQDARRYSLQIVDILGFIITIGIIFYDIRNTQFYDAAAHRAKWLEARLEIHIG